MAGPTSASVSDFDFHLKDGFLILWCLTVSGYDGVVKCTRLGLAAWREVRWVADVTARALRDRSLCLAWNTVYPSHTSPG
ncbi:hypothetical protein [Nocardia barduliensis]|uniref:hypothetical protein n=1 Tax=Nocardia barduliensis TaxID=2736643 RepID=UPI001574B4FE|nr:hypothetical protein [Nocardia barduliensis]